MNKTSKVLTVLLLIGVILAYAVDCSCTVDDILKASKTYLNNDRWSTEDEIESFDRKVKFNAGEFKGELFLYDMLTMAGCSVPLHKKEDRLLPPTANQWAYRRNKGFSHKWRHFAAGNIIVNPGIPKILPNGQVGIYTGDKMAITVGEDGIVRESEAMFKNRPVRIYLEPDQ